MHVIVSGARILIVRQQRTAKLLLHRVRWQRFHCLLWRWVISASPRNRCYFFQRFQLFTQEELWIFAKIKGVDIVSSWPWGVIFLGILNWTFSNLRSESPSSTRSLSLGKIGIVCIGCRNICDTFDSSKLPLLRSLSVRWSRLFVSGVRLVGSGTWCEASSCLNWLIFNLAMHRVQWTLLAHDFFWFVLPWTWHVGLLPSQV